MRLNLKSFLAACALASLAGLITPIAQAQAAATPIKICSGGEKGNYFYSVNQIAQQSKGTLDVTNVSTKGSMDNLQRLASGECDAAIIQSDAWGVYLQDNPSSALNIDRVDVLYDEYVHLYCNRASEIDTVKDLNGRTDLTVLIGQNGSGTAVTWRSLGTEDAGYASGTGPKTLPLDGLVAMTKVKSGDAACALMVTGLNSAAIKKVTEQTETIHLVPVNDMDFNDAVDPKGNDIYEFKDIPEDTYGAFQDGDDVETVALKAVLVLSNNWIAAHSEDGAYEAFLEAQLTAQPFIKEHVAPKE